MSRPVNPYPGRIEHENAMAAGVFSMEQRVPEAVGLHGTDLHALAVRNYQLGLRTGRNEGEEQRVVLADERHEAWEVGRRAGEEFADERSAQHVEGVLRLLRVRLAAPARKVGDPAEEMRTRINVVEQLVDGALSILAPDNMSTVDEDDAAEASGFTVKGFAQLEKVLIEAAEREGSHEHTLED